MNKVLLLICFAFFHPIVMGNDWSVLTPFSTLHTGGKLGVKRVLQMASYDADSYATQVQIIENLNGSISASISLRRCNSLADDATLYLESEGLEKDLMYPQNIGSKDDTLSHIFRSHSQQTVSDFLAVFYCRSILSDHVISTIESEVNAVYPNTISHIKEKANLFQKPSRSGYSLEPYRLAISKTIPWGVPIGISLFIISQVLF